jgi:hypothetical protein
LFITSLVTPPSITGVQQAQGDIKAKLNDIKASNPHLGQSLEALYVRANG